MLAESGPQPTALCARTWTAQPKVSPTAKLAARVVPGTVCTKDCPAASPRPVTVTSYWSSGLSPGAAANHVTESLSPGWPGAVQPGFTPVGEACAVAAPAFVRALLLLPSRPGGRGCVGGGVAFGDGEPRPRGPRAAGVR